MVKIDDVKDFFEYKTSKFWIAIIVVIFLNFLPIYDEAGLATLLFKTMYIETKSIYFLMGWIAIELFVIILIPFVGVQRFLVEKCKFE